MADGHLNKCIDCTKKDVKERSDRLYTNIEYVEKERARGREKYKRLGYKDKYKITKEDKRISIDGYNKRYLEKYKSKIAAQHLKRKNGYHLHHWSYNSEHYKDVIELSIQEHATIHRFLIYDQPCFMYKSLDGVLLDTKEKHLKYINSILHASE